MFTSNTDSAYPLALSVSTVELLSFGLSLHHWVHCFQVGWVGHEGQCDVLVADPVHSLVTHPQVIFHITGALRAEDQERVKAIIKKA